MTPLSACLIVKNDPHLERAVACVRPHVDEVVIVDTGSTDGTDRVAARLADRFERYLECNYADGEIAHFGMARTRSFALARNETALWLDSDDLVEGAEHLRDAVAWCDQESQGLPWRAQFPYEYERDPASGLLLTLQLRERIVAPKSAFRWWGAAEGAVHEGLSSVEPTGWRTLTPPHPIVWKHQLDPKKPRSSRNLRILGDWVERVGVGAVDPKTAFDIGLEHARVGDHHKAIGWLTTCALESEWDEERLLACMHLADLYAFYPGCEGKAEAWAYRATQTRPDLPDGYIALAKLAHAAARRAGRDDQRRLLERAVHFGEKGLGAAGAFRQTPEHPSDRAFDLPLLLQDAHARLGHPARAVAYARACARARPADRSMALLARHRERLAAAHSGKDIVIVCGETVEPWDPETPRARGIGGSETAVIEMAKRLALAAGRVRVFCRTDRPGLYDEVEYRPMADLHEAGGCDLLIAWRNAALLEFVGARAKWLWLHDVVAIGASDWTLSLADRILALSPWHVEHIRGLYPEHAHKVTLTANGIDRARFEGPAPARKPHAAIYSSSPDRGLADLLALWPAVRERVPDAELHVFYGMGQLPDGARADLEARVAQTPGAVDHGRVDQATLAGAMRRAGVWVHPSWAGDRPFYETSCIGAMEAQAAGLTIVCAERGALPQTVLSGALIGGDPREAASQAAFVDAVALAMTAERTEAERSAASARALAAFDWDPVAAQWQALAEGDLQERAPVRLTPRGRRPLVYLVLAPEASGGVVMDAAAPGAEAHGGGSRAGFIGLAGALARRGHYQVAAFSTFRERRTTADGLECVRLDELARAPRPDAVVAYYDTSPLALYGPEVLRIASHHTYTPYMHFECADVNTAPSRVALEHLREHFEPWGPWYVLPNAVGDLPVERRPVAGRVLYHTSPDRGLDLLLGALPDIRRAVPGATLHVVGPVQEIVDGKDWPGRAGAAARALRAALAEAQSAGAGALRLLGRLPRAALERELAEASVFAFPCAPASPCETFSVSVMECCKVGLPVVLAPADALESIYAGAVRMTPAPAREHMQEFTSAVIDVLTSKREQSRLAAAGRDLARAYTFERAALALEAMLSSHAKAPAASRENGAPARAGAAASDVEALGAYPG